MTPLRLASLILTHSATIIVWALLVAAAMALPPLFRARTFTTSASFAPQSSTGQYSSMSGLAAQLGVPIPSSGAQSPDFYAQLTRSREVLQSVALSPYESLSYRGQQRTLVDAIGEKSESDQERLDAAIKRLRVMVGVEVIPKTGTVIVRVTSANAKLSSEIANRLLELVNSFNLETRQSRAAAETKFIEGRLTEVRAELRRSEDELQRFLQVNRQFASPELTFMRDRLQQEVELRRGLFNTLSQAYEQSRIEQVRNTPLVSVLERPDIPVRPDSRRVLLKGLLGLVLGSLVGFLIVLTRHRLHELRAEDGEGFTHFLALRRKAADNVLHPWRSISRFLRRA